MIYTISRSPYRLLLLREFEAERTETADKARDWIGPRLSFSYRP